MVFIITFSKAMNERKDADLQERKANFRTQRSTADQLSKQQPIFQAKFYSQRSHF